MLNLQSFQKLNAGQWRGLWSAYWRLWPIILRIKLKQGAWLRKKISFIDATLESNRAASEETKCESVEPVALASDARTQHFTKALELHEAVRLAGRLHFFRTDCLAKSIALADILKCRSHSAKVFIGVSLSNKNNNKKALASHAWVELNGQMLGEPENVEHDFTVLKR